MEVENTTNPAQPSPSPGPEREVDRLQRAIEERQTEIETLKANNASMETTVQGLNHSLRDAVAAYRNALVLAHPDILPELIAGETVESLSDSITRAKAIVDTVRRAI